MKEIEYVTYGRDLRGGHASPGPGGSLSAAFGADGMSSLVLTTNLDEARQEIGLSRGKLPPPVIARLFELLRDSHYDELASAGSLQPDSATMTVGAAYKGDASPAAAVFRLREIPAPLGAYEAAAREASRQLLVQPERVVRGAAHVMKDSFSPTEPIVFRVFLQNVGRELQALDSPTRGANSIQLRLERDKPAASLDWERDVWQVEIGSGAVAGIEAPQRAEGQKRTVLAATESLTFSVRAKAPAAIGAGAFRAIVTYFSSGSPGGKVPAVEGALSMRTESFEVTGR
jgi:hypothetical protein